MIDFEQRQAMEWGIFAPQLSSDLGGLGLDMRGAAVSAVTGGHDG